MKMMNQRETDGEENGRRGRESFHADADDADADDDAADDDADDDDDDDEPTTD